MQSLVSDDFERAEQIVIDWYDGIVTSIAATDQTDYFVSLLAWDQRVDEKVYAVIPVDSITSGEIRSLVADERGLSLEERWSVLQDRINVLVRECHGAAAIVKCKDIGEVPSSVEIVQIDDDLRSQLGKEVESALSEKSIDRWIGVSGSSA